MIALVLLRSISLCKVVSGCDCGWTELEVKWCTGAVDVVRVLLRGKVKISLEGVDKQSRTPLMLATV